MLVNHETNDYPKNLRNLVEKNPLPAPKKHLDTLIPGIGIGVDTRHLMKSQSASHEVMAISTSDIQGPAPPNKNDCNVTGKNLNLNPEFARITEENVSTQHVEKPEE